MIEQLKHIIRKFPCVIIFIKSIKGGLWYKIPKRRYVVHSDCIVDFCPVIEREENYFGYYDIPSNKGNFVLGHIPQSSTKKRPLSRKTVEIAVTDLSTGQTEPLAVTTAYNWQQGARLQWIGKDKIIYNDFDPKNKKYIARVYSLKEKRIVETCDYPVQALWKDMYFLSINYRRIFAMRPDYGYRCLPAESYSKLKSTEKSDGIWRYDMLSRSSSLLHSLEEVTRCGYDPFFDKCSHNVNHLMINKSGDKFVFIHRFYFQRKRHDRLLCSDFKNVNLLLNDNLVSHYCWIDNDSILGYMRYGGQDGFYIVNTVTQTVEYCEELSKKHPYDGHPSCFNDWIVLDSYPLQNRFQRLSMYNLITKRYYHLLDVYHSITFYAQSRCDLHPRFSEDGSTVFFDSVHTGKRGQYYIRIDYSKLK